MTLPFHTPAGPNGVAVDRAGDVFVIDAVDKRVLELLVGAAAPIQLPITVSGPSGIAVNSNGDLFVAGFGVELDGQVLSTPQLLELPHGGGQISLTIPILQNFTGVAVDQADDLFVAGIPSEGLNEFMAEVPNGLAPSAAIGLPVASSPTGIASDGAGDVFLVNQGANLVQELPLVAPITVPTTVAAVPTTLAAVPTTGIAGGAQAGPSLPVTGTNSDIPLAAAAFLLALGLGAVRLRRQSLGTGEP